MSAIPALSLEEITERGIDPALRLPDGRSSNGTPLFHNPCPLCGKVRLSDKRKLGLRCLKCARAATAQRGGVTNHPLYWRLLNVRGRCEYPTATNYANYGGRGIRVCDEWRDDPWSFIRWAEANGYAPELELDRIDNDGPYAPWNCQFVTHLVNSRKCRHVRCDVETARAIKVALAAGTKYSEAAGLHGMPPMVAWHIKNGDTWRDA